MWTWDVDGNLVNLDQVWRLRVARSTAEGQEGFGVYADALPVLGAQAALLVIHLADGSEGAWGRARAAAGAWLADLGARLNPYAPPADPRRQARR